MVRMGVLRQISAMLLVELRGLVVLDECIGRLHRVSSARLAVMVMRVIVMMVMVTVVLMSAHFNLIELLIEF